MALTASYYRAEEAFAHPQSQFHQFIGKHGCLVPATASFVFSSLSAGLSVRDSRIPSVRRLPREKGTITRVPGTAISLKRSGTR
jgi:hypothetical protein